MFLTESKNVQNLNESSTFHNDATELVDHQVKLSIRLTEKFKGDNVKIKKALERSFVAACSDNGIYEKSRVKSFYDQVAHKLPANLKSLFKFSIPDVENYSFK